MVFNGGNTGGGLIGMGMVIHLQDAFSKTASAVMAKVTGLDTLTSQASEKISASLSKITTGFKLVGAGVLTFAALSLPISQAIDFESAFTGVRKTVQASEPEFKQLEDNLRGISRIAPITAVELSGIAESAGQLGVEGVDNITRFSDVIAKLSVTTNLTADTAATQMARISNVMQEPIHNIDRMGSSVVDLGNNFATTEMEITGFANRIAGAGKVSGLTTADIFGIGAAFTSVGVQAERGGTAVSKTLFKMTEAVSNGGAFLKQFADVAGTTSQHFRDTFEKDSAQAFNMFIAGLQKNGIKAVNLLDELELSDTRLQQAFVSVAGAGGIMGKAIERSSKAWRENEALTREANLRYNTTASQLEIMKNNFVDLMITMGQSLLPVVKLLAGIFRGLASAMNTVAGTVVGQTIFKLVGAFAALITVLGLYKIAVGAAGLASVAFTTAFTAMIVPMLPFIAAGAVVVGVISLITKSIKTFDSFASGAGEPLDGFAGKFQKLGGVIRGVLEIWKSATSTSFSLSADTHSALEKLGISELVVNIGTWVVRIKAFIGGMAEAFKSVFNIIRSAINTGINWINKLGDTFGFLKIGKTTSDLMDWAQAGKIVAAMIMVTLVPAILSLAAGVIAATWPFLAIGAAVAGVILIFKNFGKITDWLSEKMHQMWEFGKDAAQQFLDFHIEMVQGFIGVGKGIVNAIWNGIKSGWGWLTGKFTGLLSSLPGGGYILDLFGVESPQETSEASGVVPSSPFSGPSAEPTELSQLSSSSTSSTINTTTNNRTETLEIIRDVEVNLDGRKVGSILNKRNKLILSQ